MELAPLRCMVEDWLLLWFPIAVFWGTVGWLTFTAMCEETESSMEEAARDLQTEQWKELEEMWEKQMLTLELEEMLEEEADQIREIRLEMEQLPEKESQVRELQIALDIVEISESQLQQEAGAEAGPRAARPVAAVAQSLSPAAGADVFSSSLEDEENQAGVAICSIQKARAQQQGVATLLLALPHLRKSQGNIINISSLVGAIGQSQAVPFVATKFVYRLPKSNVNLPGLGYRHYTKGGSNMTKGLALDESQYGIRVNCISPGNIWTPLWEELAASTPDPRPQSKRAQWPSPWAAWASQPAEVGAAAVFLASEASFCTGTELLVIRDAELGYGCKARRDSPVETHAIPF